MQALLRHVQERGGRLIASGDTRQHGAVEASDALRAIEKYSGLRAAELHEIRRQDPRRAETASERDFIEEYHARFGNVIDTDRAREFRPDYCRSKASRRRLSRAVYQPAKALADEIYRRSICAAEAASGWRILFTSGGTGAGKSTALAWLSEEPQPGDDFDMLVDGTLSDHQAAQEKIREALAAGHRVTVAHVHRAFAETVRMVVKRAVEQGRTVTLDNIAVTHFRSRETLLRLAEEFGSRIKIRVLENRTEEPSRAISMTELAGRRRESIDQLRKLAHTLLENEFGSLKIEYPEIHEAFLQKGSRR